MTSFSWTLDPWLPGSSSSWFSFFEKYLPLISLPFQRGEECTRELEVAMLVVRELWMAKEEPRQLLKRVWSVAQSSREHAPRPPHTTKLWFLYLSATSFSVPTFMWVINHLDNWSAISIPSWLKKKKEAKIVPRVLHLGIWDVAAFRGCFHFYN